MFMSGVVHIAILTNYTKCQFLLIFVEPCSFAATVCVSL